MARRKHNSAFLAAPYILGALLVFGIAGYVFYTTISAEQKRVELLTQMQIEKIAQEANTSVQAANERLMQTQAELAATKKEIQKSINSNNEKILEQVESKIIAEKIVNSPDITSVVKEWSPSVAFVACVFADGNIGWGSGFLTNLTNGGITVVTNKHVITDDVGYGALKCAVSIPGDGQNTYVVSVDKMNILTQYDVGYLHINNGDSYFNSVAQKKLTICQTQAQTGDNVLVLGYPQYAGQFNEPTLTKGSISGYASPYYTTDAAIESGNSGGVAINPDKNCYVGIPSAVKIGNFANLGRILNAAVPFRLTYSVQATALPISSPAYTLPTYTPPSQDNRTIGENYYKANKTCVGLSGDQYGYCLSYAYNH